MESPNETNLMYKNSSHIDNSQKNNQENIIRKTSIYESQTVESNISRLTNDHQKPISISIVNSISPSTHLNNCFAESKVNSTKANSKATNKVNMLSMPVTSEFQVIKHKQISTNSPNTKLDSNNQSHRQKHSNIVEKQGFDKLDMNKTENYGKKNNHNIELKLGFMQRQEVGCSNTDNLQKKEHVSETITAKDNSNYNNNDNENNNNSKNKQKEISNTKSSQIRPSRLKNPIKGSLLKNDGNKEEEGEIYTNIRVKDNSYTPSTKNIQRNLSTGKKNIIYKSLLDDEYYTKINNNNIRNLKFPQRNYNGASVDIYATRKQSGRDCFNDNNNDNYKFKAKEKEDYKEKGELREREKEKEEERERGRSKDSFNITIKRQKTSRSISISGNEKNKLKNNNNNNNNNNNTSNNNNQSPILTYKLNLYEIKSHDCKTPDLNAENSNKNINNSNTNNNNIKIVTNDGQPSGYKSDFNNLSKGVVNTKTDSQSAELKLNRDKKINNAEFPSPFNIPSPEENGLLQDSIENIVGKKKVNNDNPDTNSKNSNEKSNNKPKSSKTIPKEDNENGSVVLNSNNNNENNEDCSNNINNNNNNNYNNYNNNNLNINIINNNIIPCNQEDHLITLGTENNNYNSRQQQQESEFMEIISDKQKPLRYKPNNILDGHEFYKFRYICRKLREIYSSGLKQILDNNLQLRSDDRQVIHFSRLFLLKIETAYFQFNMSKFNDSYLTLKESGIIDNEEEFVEILILFLGFDKTIIGEFLSKNKGMNKGYCMLHFFIHKMDFENMDFLFAFRFLWQTFIPPKDTNLVLEIINVFTIVYEKDNPEYYSSDDLYLLCSTMMALNTSLHKNISTIKPLPLETFIQMNQNIGRDDLIGIYKELQINKLDFKDDYQENFVKLALEIRTMSQENNNNNNNNNNQFTAKNEKDNDPNNISYTSNNLQKKEAKGESLKKDKDNRQEAILLNNQKYLEDLITMLKLGEDFIKYGRKGDPHTRKVFLTKDEKYLCWKKVGCGLFAKEGSIPVSELKQCYYGIQQSEIFFKNNVRKDFEQNCFSIVASKRTLDLSHENIEITRKWFKAIKEFIGKYQADEKLKKKSLKSGSTKVISDIWKSKILPNWGKYRPYLVSGKPLSSNNIETPIEEARRNIYYLWSLGLPDFVRAKMWKIIIGNRLNISEILFAKYLMDLEEYNKEDKKNLMFNANVNSRNNKYRTNNFQQRLGELNYSNFLSASNDKTNNNFHGSFGNQEMLNQNINSNYNTNNNNNIKESKTNININNTNNMINIQEILNDNNDFDDQPRNSLENLRSSDIKNINNNNNNNNNNTSHIHEVDGNKESFLFGKRLSRENVYRDNSENKGREHNEDISLKNIGGFMTIGDIGEIRKRSVFLINNIKENSSSPLFELIMKDIEKAFFDLNIEYKDLKNYKTSNNININKIYSAINSSKRKLLNNDSEESLKILEFKKEVIIVILCFRYFRPEINYTSDLTYITLIIMLNSEDYFESFCNLTNFIINNYFLFFLKENEIFSKSRYLFMEKVFQKHLPLLYKQFQLFGYQTNLFFYEWIPCLFSKFFKYKTVLRLWDCFLIKKEVFVYEVAVALLLFMEKDLRQATFEDMRNYLFSFNYKYCEEDFFDLLSTIDLSESYSKMIEDFHLNEEKGEFLETLILEKDIIN